jgi:hypothetical protein
MSSFYSDASLVMIPSGYKTSKVYSAKPTDGLGDLSFTRSNDTATRVGPDGLIEKVRTNLFLQSQDFATTWGTSAGITLTSGQTDPFGGTDAFLVSFGTTLGNSISQSLSVVAGVQYTMSAYIKGVDLTGLRMIVAGNSSASVMSQVVNGTWVRVVITGTAATTGSLVNQIARSDNTLDQSFYIYGAQIETGDIATDYIATTTAAVSVGPVANVPRLDYLGSSCPRLLLEPQRTNNAQYSEQLDNAWWAYSRQSVTANNTTAPDGYSSADLLIPEAGTGDHYVLSSTVSNTASQVVTLSLFIKKKDHDYFYMGTGGASAFGAVVYQFSTNTFTLSGLSATATNYGNGWIRLTITGTTGATDLRMLFTPTDATGTRTFNANGTDGTWVWGMQAETAASYATSYIPTLGSASTRGSDAASKTGISSLIGQTEGTLFVDMEFEGYDNLPKWIAFLGSGSSYIGLYTTTASRFFAEVANSGVQFSSATFVFAVGQRYKLALAYKENDFAFYVNGTQVATDNNGTVPATSQFAFEYSTTANNLTARNYNQALLFKTRLSNSSLAELTA